jgi:hypothetical protein
MWPATRSSRKQMFNERERNVACHPKLARADVQRARAKGGGEAGIRTLGTAFRPYNGLANRRLQPLGHLTAWELPSILRVFPVKAELPRSTVPRSVPRRPATPALSCRDDPLYRPSHRRRRCTWPGSRSGPLSRTLAALPGDGRHCFARPRAFTMKEHGAGRSFPFRSGCRRRPSAGLPRKARAGGHQHSGNAWQKEVSSGIRSLSHCLRDSSPRIGSCAGSSIDLTADPLGGYIVNHNSQWHRSSILKFVRSRSRGPR